MTKKKYMTKKKQTLKFTYNFFIDPTDKRTDIYVGEVKDGVPHGKGEYKTHTGIRWTGRFKNGNLIKGTEFDDWGESTREVNGTFKNINTTKQKNKDFEANGYGTAKFVYYSFNGEQCHPKYANEIEYDIYKGYWKDGLQHGKGTYTMYADEKCSKVIAKYTGYFRQEAYHGQGEIIHYKNNKWNKKWIGKFKAYNLPKGTYIHKYKDEIFEYKGELKHISGYDEFATPHGKGTMKHSMPKMKAYFLSKGIWKKGLLEGKGQIAYFKNKNLTSKFFEYKGSFKDNNRHGFGTLIKYEKNKKYKYVGNWKKDKEHGIGKAFLPNGDTYEGDFKNGSITGNGIFKWTNGESYEGKFKDGYKHGLGVMTYKSKKYKSKSQVMVKYQKDKLKKVLGKI